MWISILNHYLDLLAFVVISAVMIAALHWYLRRRCQIGLNRRVLIGLAACVLLGSTLAWNAGEQERDQLRAMLEGFAPTYAGEMARLGHAQINANTDPNDPTYLGLIDAEKRWLAANPAVNDIYTFRLAKDTDHAHFVVDSETDYNHNGKIDEDREQRTAINEEYTEPMPEWHPVMDGTAIFQDAPYADKWGVWVTAACPIFDAQGRVEAGLGVDFDASHWTHAILARRAGVIGFVAAAMGIFVGATSLLTFSRAEIVRRQQIEQSLRDSEGRLRMILENEPEAVMLIDRQGAIRELNPSGSNLLELESPTAIADRTLLSFAAPEQRVAVEQWLTSVADGKAGRFTMRLRAARGSERWVEAHGVPFRSEKDRNAATLIVARDVTAARAAEAERERLQSQLVAASRQAGMAEVATGVLHNVGNVLNTVDLSAHLLTDKVRQSPVAGLNKATQMLVDQGDSVGAFLMTDERGKRLPEYLQKVSGMLRSDHEQALGMLTEMSSGLEHLKAIIHAHQAMAKTSLVEELVRPSAMLEEAVKLNIVSCERHHVLVACEFDEITPILLDKHKVLQILINLISNAKNALKDSPNLEKKITLRLTTGSITGKPSIKFEVQDNGSGIAPETMQKIFGMGFTTRKEGHGHGLHSSANLAGEMHGSLKAYSEGLGKGARFVLELPMNQERVRA